MLRIRLTVAALADFKSIGRYTRQQWGKAQRDKYLGALDLAFRQIAAEPERGRSCDAVRLGYRKYQVGRHMVFYRVNGACLEIIRILHDRMDVESGFGG